MQMHAVGGLRLVGVRRPFGVLQNTPAKLNSIVRYTGFNFNKKLLPRPLLTKENRPQFLRHALLFTCSSRAIFFTPKTPTPLNFVPEGLRSLILDADQKQPLETKVSDFKLSQPQTVAGNNQ